MVEWLSGLPLFDVAVMVGSALVALGVLIAFHEYGHFYVARRCGVFVEQFSIGFGPALWSGRDRHGTEYRLALLPLGGFVKMRGESGALDGYSADSYQAKTVWQRMAIVVAGPVANFILAVFFFWVVLLGGERDLAPQLGAIAAGSPAAEAGLEEGMLVESIGGVAVATLGDVNRELFHYLGNSGVIELSARHSDGSLADYQLPINRWLSEREAPQPLQALGISPPYTLDALLVRAVGAGSPAAASGLLVDDKIVALNGRPLGSAAAFSQALTAAAGEPVWLTVVGGESAGQGRELSVAAAPVLRDGVSRWQIGIEFSQLGSYPEALWRDVSYNPVSAAVRAVGQTAEMSQLVLASVGKLVSGQLSPKNLSGPITIAKVAGDSAQSGWDNFLRFVAFLSIMLGVMNLLPIPVLDGGRLMFYAMEAVRGRPISDRIQQVAMQWGLAVMLGLMGLALFNDLT